MQKKTTTTRRKPTEPKTIKGVIVRLFWKYPKMFLTFLMLLFIIGGFFLTCQFTFKSKWINVEKDKLDADQIRAIKQAPQRKRK